MNISVVDIIIAALSLGGIGVGFALLLSVSYKLLSVKGDPQLELFLSILPNSNCGACGFAGCMGFAENLAASRAEVSGCLAGGKAVASKLAEALGVKLEESTEEIAFVACRAGRSVSPLKYIYDGVDNCQAANILFGGDKACDYGCLGLGSCERACPFDAIFVNDDGLAVVDRKKCKSCRKCVAACPRKLIVMVPKDQEILVACKNLDRGKRAKEVCGISCTACKICEKNCPEKAITVVNNLAVIDFSKCTECGICMEKCPQNTIIKIALSVGVEQKVREKAVAG